MFLVLGGGNEHVVGDLGDELADPRANDLVGASRGIGVGWVLLLQLHDPGLQDDVRVRDGQRTQHTVLEELDGAPVGEVRHCQMRDRLQGVFVVQAAGELDACVGEELELGLSVGHVGNDPDPLERLGAGVGEDAEELELGRIEGSLGKGKADDADAAAGDLQREADQGAFAVGGHLQVGIPGMKLVGAGDHDCVARTDGFAGGGVGATG